MIRDSLSLTTNSLWDSVISQSSCLLLMALFSLHLPRYASVLGFILLLLRDGQRFFTFSSSQFFHSSSNSTEARFVFSSVFVFPKGVKCTTFTLVNKCDFPVWPGILSGSGSPKLDSTGFELSKDTSRTFRAPAGWSGRFWGRTGCNFDGSSSTTSWSTGDCGSGEMECNGSGAEPPATLAEFTLGISGSLDFYDVSLVDGYNLPMIVEGSGLCPTTGCVTDLNQNCPTELKAKRSLACRSACEAFGRPEYCCSGAYGSPDSCKPSMYSQVFKSACPKSYSYAYDDATSTFTCSGADYTITFCPKLSR